MTKSRYKKIALIVLVFLIIILFVNIGTTVCAENNYSNYISEILNNANAQLSNMNFDQIDEILSCNTSLIPNFKQTISNLLQGDYFTDFGGLIKLLLDIVRLSIKTIFPTIILVLAISILGNITSSVSSDNSNEANKIINIIISAMVLIIVIINIKNVISLCKNCINNITTQMDVIFPILITLLVSVGGAVSASIYNPTIALISSLISKVFTYFLYPVFIISLILTILNNINSHVKLKKFNGFIASLFKWTVGIVFTIFSALLTVQGISAGKYDSVSFRTAKFAVKSYIPIIGGYLSDGLDFVVLASVLVKNAVGAVGLIALLFTIISPILQIVVLKLSLQFTAGLIEGVGDGRVSSMLDDMSKVLIYPIVIILAISFMYVLMLTLFIMTANII